MTKRKKFSRTVTVISLAAGKAPKLRIKIESVTITGRKKWAVTQAARKFLDSETMDRLIMHGMSQKISDAYARNPIPSLEQALKEIKK